MVCTHISGQGKNKLKKTLGMLLVSLLVFSILTIILYTYTEENYNVSVPSVVPIKTIVGEGITMRVFGLKLNSSMKYCYIRYKSPH